MNEEQTGIALNAQEELLVQSQRWAGLSKSHQAWPYWICKGDLSWDTLNEVHLTEKHTMLFNNTRKPNKEKNLYTTENNSQSINFVELSWVKWLVKKLNGGERDLLCFSFLDIKSHFLKIKVLRDVHWYLNMKSLEFKTKDQDSCLNMYSALFRLLNIHKYRDQDFLVVNSEF